MMGQHTFKKHERLCSKSVIKELFEKGSSFYLYPFKVFFLENREVSANVHQCLFSVPKRNFKRAVDRNLLKRRLREAYRLNKALMGGEKKYFIAYIYTAKEKLPFSTIEEKLKSTLVRLSS